MQEHANLKKPVAGEVICLDIPPQYKYSSLELVDDKDGCIEYNQTLVASLLRHNGFEFSEFSDEDLLNLIHYWYLDHLDIGGERDAFSDSLFGLNNKSNQAVNCIISSPDAKTIRELRLKTNLSQSETAELLGLSSRQLISDYERGVKAPSDQIYTLWLLLSGQHPTLNVVAKQQ